MTKKNIIIVIVSVFVLAVIIITSTKSDSREFNQGKWKYKEYTVQKGTFKILVTANGSIIPIDRVEIKSKASGLIEELPIEQGDYIKKGDLIARLDQKDERAAVSQAQANFDIATAELAKSERSYTRLNKLFIDKLISEEELDQIELELAIARGKLVQATTSFDRAKERFSESIVRAPIDGVILQKYVEKGQIIASGISNVSGGTPIVDIADMSSVYIQAGVDEIDIGKMEVGHSALVIADAYPQTMFKGNIVRIAPEAKIENNVTLFDVIVLVKNTEGKLKSGMNTAIEITIVENKEVLLIPVIALLPTEGMGGEKQLRQVMIKEGYNFHPHTVETGLDNFKDVVILDGLQEGDILGVPMTSRLMEANQRMDTRIRSSRSFGTSSK